MIIILKNKVSLKFDEFLFKCSIGKKGLTKKKIEGDKKTPIGKFSLGNLYYRSDRILKPITRLKCIKIRKEMGWCDDIQSEKKYNKRRNRTEKVKHERLYRKDHKSDLLIPIKYNTKNLNLVKAVYFFHLTSNYKPTKGCVALKKKDFLIMLKLINTKTKIKIF